MMIHSFNLAALFALTSIVAAAEPATSGVAHAELGAVQWQRDYDTAATRAREEHKPLLVLFTELPGSEVTRNYVRDVLSHPLIVEAIETQFVPLAIASNAEGRDREILTSFCETPHANSIIRIVDVSTQTRTDIVPRLADDTSLAAMTSALVATLQKRDSHVPAYLSLLDEEERGHAKPLPPAVFAMSDPVLGEEKLGAFKGVIATRIGTLAGKPVLELTYDSAAINFANIVREARRLDCAEFVYARTDDQYRYARRVLGSSIERSDEPLIPQSERSLERLRATVYRGVPMTPIQALHVNAALASGGNPDDFLSLRQIRFRGIAARHSDARWPDVTGRRDLATAFEEAEWFAATLEKPAP